MMLMVFKLFDRCYVVFVVFSRFVVCLLCCMWFAIQFTCLMVGKVVERFDNVILFCYTQDAHTRCEPEPEGAAHGSNSHAADQGA